MQLLGREATMNLACKVGGARGMFEARVAEEVSERIDQAFGAEVGWESEEQRGFGELEGTLWAEFQDRAVAELTAENLPNLLAMGAEGRGVYLPANVQAVSLPLSAGCPLRCASLTGLRRELFELADRWALPVDDESLSAILDDIQSRGATDAPEVVAFARLTLAANEAMRRDCPLWLFGH
jgi:hypothetical protein